MKGITKFTVTCQKCGKQDEIGLINDSTLVWENNKHIISGRKRLDGEWGFQCVNCGENDLLTEQEQEEIQDKQNPDPKDIARVVKKLKVQKPKFKMTKL